MDVIQKILSNAVAKDKDDIGYAIVQIGLTLELARRRSIHKAGREVDAEYRGILGDDVIDSDLTVVTPEYAISSLLQFDSRVVEMPEFYQLLSRWPSSAGAYYIHACLARPCEGGDECKAQALLAIASYPRSMFTDSQCVSMRTAALECSMSSDYHLSQAGQCAIGYLSR